MIPWLTRNAPAIEAIAAMITAIVAIMALVGVVYQVQAADRQSRAQSARDIYREHLSLSVQNPDFAAPADAASLLAGPRAAAYGAYVEHLIYTAEQVMGSEAGWESVFFPLFERHAHYICDYDLSDLFADEHPPVTALLLRAEWAQICAAQQR